MATELTDIFGRIREPRFQRRSHLLAQ